MLNVFRSLVVVMALGGTAIGCAQTSTRESTGEYIDSATITTKVKAALVQDETTKARQISVETFRDVVQLSGFVDSATEKARAEQIARGVEGVRAVRNDLIVRTRQ
ncbi:BON domain-containing protein [uncultured Ferrovibrio sp.]|jgi:hyperosmotically inducible protein|uniref:BON domain-containing protein n=1 Tax=uncultured Ferrovibrio sp. TaxID=1576913 RepID=UPI00263304C0|nr:BON domain-containing protein [uncultured Ferrovibrio sp.]